MTEETTSTIHSHSPISTYYQYQFTFCRYMFFGKF